MVSQIFLSWGESLYLIQSGEQGHGAYGSGMATIFFFTHMIEHDVGIRISPPNPA